MLVVHKLELVINLSYCKRNKYNDKYVTVWVRDTITGRVLKEDNWTKKTIFGVTDLFLVVVSDIAWRGLDYIPYVKRSFNETLNDFKLDTIIPDSKFRCIYIGNIELATITPENGAIYIIGDSISNYGVADSFINVANNMFYNDIIACFCIYDFIYGLVCAYPEYAKYDNVKIWNVNGIEIEIGLTKELINLMVKDRVLKGR